MSDDKKKISLPIVGAEAEQSDQPKSREEGGDIHSEIQKEVTENKVVLYMKGTPQQPMCGFSAKAAAVVASYGVPFYTVNVLEDPEKRQGIKDFGEWPTIPQLYVDGELLGGSDIVAKMHESGQLNDVIEQAFADESEA